MNKEKAKNITLGVSLILNLLGSLLIGGSLIHACNASASPENAVSSVSIASAGKLHGLQHRNAPVGGYDVEDIDIPDSDNLMLSADQSAGMWFSHSGTNSDVTLYGNASRWWDIVYLVPVKPDETYYFKSDDVSGETASQGSIVIGDSTLSVGFQWMKDELENPTQSGNPQYTIYTTSSAPLEGRLLKSSSFFFKTPTYATNMLVYAHKMKLIGLALASALSIPPFEEVSFPSDYNPITPFGYASDGLIGQLAGSASSPFNLDLVFVSGGHVFKRIDYYFLDAQGLEYTPTGSDHSSTFQPTGYVYASLINFVDLNDVVFPAWRAVFGVTSNGNVYLKNYGEWISTEYQTINVLAYDPTTGISGLVPSLDQLGLLSLRTNYGVPPNVIGGGGYADVFTLLGTAFSSLAPILSVQILPYLTLGTLLLVPLVVLIIFAILKVLNK